jgi:hypothetical protein
VYLGLRGNTWVTGHRRKLDVEELYDLYSPPNIIRMIKMRTRWVGHVARTEQKGNACRVLVWKAARKRPLVRIMFKSQENIKVYVDKRRSGFFWLRIRTNGGVLMNAVMNTKLTKNAELFLTI